MSYQAGDACFDTLGAAATALASRAVGQVVPAGSIVYVVDAAGSSDGSIAYTLADVTGATADVAYSTTPTYPACVLLGAADAAAMGWGVLIAWLGAWALLAIRKAL